MVIFAIDVVQEIVDGGGGGTCYCRYSITAGFLGYLGGEGRGGEGRGGEGRGGEGRGGEGRGGEGREGGKK